MSFGDSAINYELRGWVEDFAQWARIHTELAAAVYTALQRAGMDIPFPQQEVRLVGGLGTAPKIPCTVGDHGG